MIGSCGSVLLLILLFVGIFYQSVTLNFLGSAFGEKEKIENFQVIVLNESNYGSLKEMKNGKIGLPKTSYSEGSSKIQTEIKKMTSLTIQETDYSDLVTLLLNKSLRVIVMEEAQKNLYMELDDNFKNGVKVLETIPIKIKNTTVKKDVEIAKKPFNIFVSGSDEYGKINQVSRSDVDMIITVNPITHKVLLTSIPRDYYVTLHGIGKKDKLTHASLYGIDTSIKTLETMLDIDINYYLKINFSSIIKLVDAVGGIEVDSDSAFTASYFDEPVRRWVNFSFTKGINQLDGVHALAFARERHSFSSGDMKRALHQQMVLSALIKKVSGPTILTKYPEILKALNGSFETNVSQEEIMGFLQKQLDKNPEWEISTNILEGDDSSQYTYSIPKSKSSVLIPKEESIATVKEKINQIFQ